MSNIKVGLILAAGNGRRIASVSGDLPKPLVELHGRPLLEHVLLGASEAGIQHFVVVVGYGANAIRSWLAGRSLDGPRITLVENCEYGKDNGVSVLKARDKINEPFMLLMADHIFEPETAASLLEEHIREDETILAVDYKLDRLFDIDDATKVACSNGFIIDIGKQITTYNAADTGMFLCTPAIFSSLESKMKNGNCSLSDGMRDMARRRKLRAFDIGDGLWQDVDTPEALAYAKKVFPVPYRSYEVAEEIHSV